MGLFEVGCFLLQLNNVFGYNAVVCPPPQESQTESHNVNLKLNRSLPWKGSLLPKISEVSHQTSPNAQDFRCLHGWAKRDVFRVVYSLVVWHFLCGSGAVLEAAVSIVLWWGVSTYYTSQMVQRTYERGGGEEMELLIFASDKIPITLSVLFLTEINLPCKYWEPKCHRKSHLISHATRIKNGLPRMMIRFFYTHQLLFFSTLLSDSNEGMLRWKHMAMTPHVQMWSPPPPHTHTPYMLYKQVLNLQQSSILFPFVPSHPPFISPGPAAHLWFWKKIKGYILGSQLSSFLIAEELIAAHHLSQTVKNLL